MAQQNGGYLLGNNEATGFALALQPSPWRLLNDHTLLQCIASVEEMYGYLLWLVGGVLLEVELYLADAYQTERDALFAE